MNFPRYLTTGGVALLAVALALAVGYWNIRPASFTPQTVQAPLQPDFFMDNAKIRQLNEQGQPVYDLHSVRAAHQVGKDVTELDAPKLLHYREDDQQPWDVQSRYGEVSAGGDQVVLSQNVVIEQQLAGQSARRLSTPELTIFPERNFAETDRSVRIEALNGVTTATGMEANFNDGSIKLLSNVRGEHDAL
ncbi:LPS export ABC transporter periplasmic protein LptC [Pseudomonas sp. FME51]|uniref:LPS export ABC transporter periplasmic protein LptC n=1 Tax=Pseudomonas sp. FME51 TaxID=2742609 RepID=UPI001867B102|nr:LPS export ABC transporter periplasmic protein LptC [Pseudomonas sp. FME51]